MPDGGFLARLFRVAINRDGQASGVEAMAEEGAAMTAAEDRMEAGLSAAVAARKRAPEQPRAVLDERVAQKILHAWLQNRHQTLFPLTISLRSMAAEQKGVLLRAMAVAITCGSPAPPGRRERLNGWLTSVGGSEADRWTLAETLARPPALSTLLDEAAAAKLAPLAYAMAVAALEQGDPTNVLFLEYFASRLALPLTVVRSANRRYRV